MLNDITIGQFFPGDSVIHRCDPRVKFVLIFAYIVMIFVSHNYVGLFITAAIIFLIMFLSKISFKTYLKSLKPIIPIVIFTSVLNIFYVQGENILIDAGWFKISLEGIETAGLLIIRICCLLLISSVLTYTTSPTDLTDAMERLMKPLKYIKVPVHELSMMMTIALRFVPTLIEETDKIMSAQKARGADMDSGGLIKRVKALVPVLIPLFVSSFRRAYELALAMECRCYKGGEGRTRMKILHIKRNDIIIILLLFIIFAGVIITNIYFEPII